jgi:hypothetical protein
MNLKPIIVYRSPAGRVASFRMADGVELARWEPGDEADAVWERLGRTKEVVMKDRAEWLDVPPSWREEQGSEPKEEEGR